MTVSWIPRLFRQYDGVTIEGAAAEDVNGEKILYALGGGEEQRDYLVLVGLIDAAFTQSGTLRIRRRIPDMDFVCDSKAALLAYANPTPAIDEPSAGYTLAWDMLGNGSYLAFDQFEGEKGTHTEFIEGLMSSTPKKVCDELGYFMKDCCA